MNGNLPWALIFIGVFIAIVVEILGIPILPVAIGLYLPLELSSTIIIGGLIRYVVDRRRKDKEKNPDANRGVLFSSGMIAGEGLVGIIIAILTVANIDKKLDLSRFNTGTVGGIVLIVAVAACVLLFAAEKRKKGNEEENK